LIQKVAGATPATYTPIVTTIADIVSYTNINTPYYSQQVTVQGMLVIGTNDGTSWLIDGNGNKLVFSYMVPNYTTTPLKAMNGKQVIATVTINDYHSNNGWRITGVFSTFVLTEEEVAANEAADLTFNQSVTSGDIVNLPTVSGTSTVTWALATTTFATLDGSVLTIGSVDATQTITLTATLSHPVAGKDPIVTTKDFTVTISTLETKLNADLAALTVADQTEISVLNLPTTGPNGSAIVWTMDASDFATLSGATLTLNYKGSAYTVTLHAALSLGTYTGTKDFTINVAANDYNTIGEAIDLVQALGTATASIDGTAIWIEGTIVGFKWASNFTQYQGIFVSDGTDVLFVYKTVATDAFAVGDVIIAKGLYCTYYYLPELKNLTNIQKITGTPAAYSPVVTTIADVVSYTNVNTPLYSQKIQVQGTLVIGTNDYTSWLIDGNGNKLVFTYIVPNYTTTELLALNGKEVTATVFLNDKHSTYGWRITGVGATFVITEAQIAKDEIAALVIDQSVESGDVIALPTLAGTSTVSWALAETTFATLSGSSLTIGNVDATQTITLTATFSHPVSGGDPIVTTKDFVITISTPEAKLNADKDALVIAAQNELSTLTLPTLGANGSAITWTMDASADATLSGATVTLNYKGSAYEITIHASLTLGSFSATKDFVVVVNPRSVYSELGQLNKKTDGTNWDVANATGVYLRGVVTAIKGTSGVFIQDADGDGMYCYGINATTAGLVVGDEVIVKGNLVVYNSVRELESSSLQAELSSGNALVYTPMTLAQVEAMYPVFWEYQGKLVTVSGLTINAFSGNYMNLNWANVSSVQHLLAINYKSNLLWTADVYKAGDTLPEFSFVFYNIFTNSGVNSYNLEGVDLAMTDLQKVTYDLSQIPSTLELTLDYEYPASKYGSVYSSVINEALNGFLANAAGGFDVTLPTDADKVGTVTVTATIGGVSVSKDITVTVKFITDADKVALTKADILSKLNGETKNPGNVLDLAISGLYGTTISWATDNELINVTTGLVGATSVDVTVTLTATITFNAASDTAVCTINVSPHILAYYTGFEDVTGTDPNGLSGYSDTAFVSASQSWIAYQAYRGTTPSTDFPIGSVDIRLKSASTTAMAYISTGFTVTNVSKISIKYCDFYNETSFHTKGALYIQVSKDGTNWVTVGFHNDSAATTTMTLVTATIDYSQAELVTAGITAADALYVRLVICCIPERTKHRHRRTFHLSQITSSFFPA
jgi:hypothetical protein